MGNKRDTPREHGRVKYVVERCRCDVCREAARQYEQMRRVRLVPTLVDATKAREHVRHLMSLGMGYKRIAEVAGVGSGTVMAMLYGKPNRQPTRRIKPETEAALLAVQFSPNDGALVDNATTLRQIDAMVAAGIPRARIAERIGCDRPALQIAGEKITAKNARGVDQMYREFVAGTLVTFRESRHGRKVLTFDAQPEPGPIWTADELAAFDQLVAELADVLEQRIDENHWRRHAACIGRPVWMWFPARGDAITGDYAKSICGACNVRQQCLDTHIDERVGIYGGKSQRQLRALRKELGRLCVQCGERFQATADNIVICSQECRKARHRRQKMASADRQRASA
jgi:hypothetical protein